MHDFKKYKQIEHNQMKNQINNKPQNYDQESKYFKNTNKKKN